MEMGSYLPNSASESVITSSGGQSTNTFSNEGNIHHCSAHLDDEMPQIVLCEISLCSSMGVKCTRIQGIAHSGNNSQNASDNSDFESRTQGSSLTATKSQNASDTLDFESGTQGSSLTATKSYLSGAKSLESLYSASQIGLLSTFHHLPLQSTHCLKGFGCVMLETETKLSTPNVVKEKETVGHSTDILGNLSDMICPLDTRNIIMNENGHSTSLNEQGSSCSSTKLHFPVTNVSNQSALSSQGNKINVLGNYPVGSTSVKKSFASQNGLDNYEELIGAVGGCDQSSEVNNSKHKCVPPIRLGLLGGGENSVNNGTSTWNSGSQGSAGASNWSVNNNNSAGAHFNSIGRQGGPGFSSGSNCDDQGRSLPNTWALAAGKGLDSNPTNGNVLNGQNSQNENGHSVKLYNEEHLSEIHSTAAQNDGWGKTVINQDSSWDDPNSSPKETDSSVWEGSANSGTEIWENNIRNPNNGGSMATPGRNNSLPLGHTPSTHLGGTWGEEEDTNMWSGIDQGPNILGNSGRQDQWCGPGRRSRVEPGVASSGPGNRQETGGSMCNKVTSRTWSPVATPKKKDFQASGWEGYSNPVTSHPTSSFDDGTSMWGNPQRQGKVCNWKDMLPSKPTSGIGIIGGNVPRFRPSLPPSGPGMIRLPPSFSPSNKPDVGPTLLGKMSALNHGPNWSDLPHRGSPGPGVWDETHIYPAFKNMPGSPNWGESNHPMGPTYWGAKPKTASTLNFDGQINTSGWASVKSSKPLGKDLICTSKQYRVLSEMGYKKEDVENALRNNNMSLEEALGELHTLANKDKNLMDVVGGYHKMQTIVDDVSLNDPLADSMCGAIQDYEGIHVPPVFGGIQTFKHQKHGTLNALSGRMNQPSAAHLKVLVQQIQVAVQAGHLNPQILNQPLAPQTLQLLYQLLQEIKLLYEIQQLHGSQQFGKGGPLPPQLNVHMTQTKQRIHSLRNQIAAQQANFIKHHQVHQQLPETANLSTLQSPSHELFKPGLEHLTSELSIKEPSTLKPLSRLSQWKLPSLDKDEQNLLVGNTERSNNGLGDFSRAPGTVSKLGTSLHASLSSPVINLSESLPCTLNCPGAWPVSPSEGTRIIHLHNNMSMNNMNSSDSTSISSSTRNVESEPKATTSSTTSAQPSCNLNDLVTEFEPGKPWKSISHGKNVEGDNHLTPSSTACSPFSLSSIKDTDWTSKSRPSPTSSGDSLVASLASLTSSPWTFNPVTSNDSGCKPGWGQLGPRKLPLSGAWGAPGSKIHRPPGFIGQGKAVDKQNSFLVLRNLTPQIDGSTLKTLCLQHGPLQLFHLLLNKGIAIVKYSTKEESAKAQSALNNCVLGNTTIFAEIPTEAEVQNYLHHTGSGHTSGVLHDMTCGTNSEKELTQLMSPKEPTVKKSKQFLFM
ncbi:protein Gawky-like isoform X2 [Limulus polyphemus]|uniref:Protein Gawky-like isoform X2 n=1 Tax=Limulus polyphemus TaxID=6850 RepID=A0ABM1T902_LIMPO|nr:protein Gawky-like isoform X2 [Limulus polyphemus]